MAQTDTNLTCLSLNVRGLQRKSKRDNVFFWLKKQNVDICMLQETHCGSKQDACKWTREWQDDAHWSSASSNSIGVAILFKKGCNHTVDNMCIHSNGRIMSVDVSIADNKFHIVNVYVPNKETDRELFLRDELPKYLEAENHMLIVGGDFNCTLNVKDRRNCKTRTEKGRKEILDIMNAYSLEDIYRTRHPTEHAYTYFKPNSNVASRIDYWITSKILNAQIDIVKTIAVPRNLSDHSGIYLNIVHTEIEKGRGRWQMNDSVVKSAMFTELFTSFWKGWQKRKGDYRDIRYWWEEGKIQIADLAIYCSKRIKKSQQDRTGEIEELLGELQNEPNPDIVRIESLHEELRKLIEHKAEGARIRAKAQWAQDGERSSKYFHQLEKVHAVNKLWTSIKDSEGNVLTGIENILHRQIEFYEELYKSEGIDDECSQELLSNVQSKLSEIDQNMCDADFTLEECTNVVQHLKCGKSPGMDGITNAFYKEFWSLIGNDFMEVISEIVLKNELCSSQYTGLIRLLYKSGEREDIGNWRPITLLNSDYKILEKVLANRMQKVLPSIIKEEQKGFMKGRHIEEHVRLMDDVIDYCETHDVDGAILCIDQSKAFDRVEWEWLYSVLKIYGFGERFISWVKLMYKSAVSCIFTNGFISRTFPISRGVRQGSPLGPYLYILQSEPLSEYIRVHPNIRGITIGDDDNRIEVKLGTFADDTQGYVSDEQSITMWFKALDCYSKASGAKMNKAKTQGLLLGSLKRIRETNVAVKWVETVKVLGVHHGVNLDRKEYWNQKLKQIENIFRVWSRRNLTLYGRVYLVKCYGMGILQNYISSIAVDSDVIKRCETLFYKFIWENGPERVKRDVCIRSVGAGGLGMIDLKTVIRACRLKLLTKIIGDKNEQWMILPRMHLKCLDSDYGEEYYMLKACAKPKNIPEFYKECVEALSILREREVFPDSNMTILNQYLWGNPRIRINGQQLHDKIWCKGGIRYVHDIMDYAGDVRRQYIQDKVSDKGSLILKLNKIVQAIPKLWRDTLKTGTPQIQTVREQDMQDEIVCVDNVHVSRKALCKRLLPVQYLSRCELYWQQKFGEVEWQKIYIHGTQSNPLLDRKLKEFKWKVINKCLTTENKLKHFVDSTGICKLCGIESEDVEHMLIDCDSLGEYWNFVKLIFRRLCDVVIMHERSFYLGIYDFDIETNTEHVLNWILEEAKWIVWKRRCAIRYDDVWWTDIQMVHMLKQRLSDRNTVLRAQVKINEYVQALLDIIQAHIALM